MLLYGAGGHAKILIECLNACQIGILGIFDDAPVQFNFQQVPLLGSYQHNIYPEKACLISIGDNNNRKKVSLKIKHAFGKIIHPSALFSPSALLGEGSVIFHQAVIQAEAIIGKHVVLNTGSITEHDCLLEDFVHLAPGAILCGNVHVGEGTLIGAGAVVLPNISIGKWCTIGAGSVVNRDIPDFSTVAGVPAKIIKQQKTIK